jgi:hypothetical protein
VAGIGQTTRGIPRLINVICDNALIDAFADESPIVEARHVLGVCRDLQLSTPLLLVSLPVPQSSPPPALAFVPATDAYPMRTLERYSPEAASRPSLLGRFRSRLKSTPRIETA